MANVIDWILDLFRDPVQARAFVNDPERAMAQAGVQGVTAAQVNAVAATVAPAAVIHGDGNPVYGLQQAVAETHGIAFTPQYQPEAFSNNDTLSHNDVLSPQAGHDVQQGGVNLDFGDITFGNKTTNVADHGGVVVDGPNSGDILTDGSVKQTGAGSTANTGDIHSGSHSPVILGNGNEVNDNSQTAGGDIIQGNEGPVIHTGDINASGGSAAGGSAGHGGGILSPGGDGGNATGGPGGTVVIAPTQTTTTTNNTGGGDVTNVETHGGGISGNVDASHHDDNSVHVDNSVHDSHNDNSVHTDNSVHQQVDTHVDTGIHLGF